MLIWPNQTPPQCAQSARNAGHSPVSPPRAQRRDFPPPEAPMGRVLPTSSARKWARFSLSSPARRGPVRSPSSQSAPRLVRDSWAPLSLLRHSPRAICTSRPRIFPCSVKAASLRPIRARHVSISSKVANRHAPRGHSEPNFSSAWNFCPSSEFVQLIAKNIRKLFS